MIEQRTGHQLSCHAYMSDNRDQDRVLLVLEDPKSTLVEAKILLTPDETRQFIEELQARLKEFGE